MIKKVIKCRYLYGGGGLHLSYKIINEIVSAIQMKIPSKYIWLDILTRDKKMSELNAFFHEKITLFCKNRLIFLIGYFLFCHRMFSAVLIH